MSTADRVLEIVAAIAETDERLHDVDIRLFDQRVLDSFQTVELILALSSVFEVEISPAEFDRDEWATPRMIASRIEQRLAGDRPN